MLMPGRGELCARPVARQREAFGGPLLEALVEQRQIEQPFAGIVDDVERQRAVRAILPLIVDHEPQLADVDGRVRPAPFLDQGADVVLIVEARHRIVGLRLEPGAGDPSRGEGLEHRKAAAAGEAVDQRGDEHGLAGARQPGDAEPHRRVEEAVAVIQQRPRRQARFLDDIGKTGGHQDSGKARCEEGGAISSKSGDWLAKIKLRGEDTMTSEVLVFFDAFSLHEPVTTSLENAMALNGSLTSRDLCFIAADHDGLGPT